MFAAFFSKLKVLLKNPMIVFIYGIISKWYIMVMISALVVTYWVFNGLASTGLIKEAESVVSKALNETKSIARYCVPKITNFGEFWDCLQDPPVYKPTSEEKKLERSLNDLVDFNNYGNTEKKNPYEE